MPYASGSTQMFICKSELKLHMTRKPGQTDIELITLQTEGLLASLKENEPFTIKEYQQYRNITRRQAEKDIQSFRNQGLIIQVGKRKKEYLFQGSEKDILELAVELAKNLHDSSLKEPSSTLQQLQASKEEH